MYIARTGQSRTYTTRTTFHRIAALDSVALDAQHQDQIRLPCDTPVAFPETDPLDQRELVRGTGGAETILLSWRSAITKSPCPSVKHICLCATSATRGDLEDAGYQ